MPQKIGRNKPCPCKSGLKFKNCHGGIAKITLCKQAANECMIKLIFQEKIKKNLICKHGVPTGQKCIDCSGVQEINIGE